LRLVTRLWEVVRRHREGLSEIAYAPFAALLSWSLFAIEGMPLTFDGFGLVFLEAYRRAYHDGDFFPIWTSFASKGHGSPFPIGYHRLHPQIFAAVALMTGSLRALKISVPILLIVGGVGARRLCRTLGVRPWVAWCSGLLLMSANYTVADWFVRGATAEFTAFMLVPWCIRYALKLFDDAWGPVRLAASSALLFYAHMMTFYFFVIVATVIILGNLWHGRPFGWARLRTPVRRGAVFVALLTCAIGPYVAAMKYALAFCGISNLSMRTDNEAFFDWSQYFVDPVFSWHRAEIEGAWSPEIGRWTLFCLAVVVVSTRAARTAIWRRIGGLALLSAFFIFVQRKPLSFLFDMLPGASKIQFPTRLLVYIVTVAIVCTAIGVEAALRSVVPWVRAVARTAPLLAVGGQVNLAYTTQKSIAATNVARADIDTAMSNPVDITTGKMAVYATWDLYLPKDLNVMPTTPFLQASDGCTVSSPRLTHGAETSVVTDNAQCNGFTFTVHGRGCTIHLNQFQSTLLRVDLSRPGDFHMAAEGTTIIDAPIDGTVVRVSERGVFDLAHKWLIGRARWPQE
jgi:hypothetical protein